MAIRILSSGCSLCATTGQCSTAYRNSPGQYCGNWFDLSTSSNKPCCCPLNSTCKVSNSQCICHVVEEPSNNFAPASHRASYHHGNYREYESGSLMGLFLFILMVVCCCLCCRKSRCENTHHHKCPDEHAPMAQAVAQAYPVQNESCPAENPAYKEYGTVHHESGGGAGMAIASGLGGLAVGTLIGDMIGRNSAELVGGGYDIVGDGAGYDIVGDSGDANNGFDIQGDS